MDPLDVLFRNLDRWRHLPSYQLERRADIFFSIYLKPLVEEFTGVPLEDEVVPELPIRRDLIWTDLPSSQSVKVDYVLFAKDRSRVFFVELKTDCASRRDRQDEYLETASRLGFRKILEGIRSILLATNAHQKYHHLSAALARLGYLRLPTDLADYIHPAPRVGLTARLNQIEVLLDSTVEVIYVQPEAVDGDRCIDFARFADFVGRHPDPVSQRFSQHLRRWCSVAGACLPD